MSDLLQNLPVERYILAGVYKNGFEGFDEASLFVTANSFNDGEHAAWWKCFEKCIKDNPS